MIECSSLRALRSLWPLFPSPSALSFQPTLHASRRKRDVFIIIAVSSLEVVGFASTTVAAASWSSALVLLLGPALVIGVSIFLQYVQWRLLHSALRGVSSIFNRHQCSLLALLLDVVIREHVDHILSAQLCVAHVHGENNISETLGQAS